MAALQDIKEQVEKDVASGLYSEDVGRSVVEKAESLDKTEPKVESKSESKGPPDTSVGADPYSDDDDAWTYSSPVPAPAPSTKVPSGLHEVTPISTAASKDIETITSTDKVPSGIHDSAHEDDPEYDAKFAAYLAESTRIREENARIAKENKLKEDTWNKYKDFHTTDGQLDASKLWATTWADKGTKAADSLIKDFRVLGYDEDTIRTIASQGTDLYIYDRATKLLDPYIGKGTTSQNIAAALNDPNISVKTFEEGGYDKKDIHKLNTYKDYIDSEGNIDLEDIIRSGKFNTLNAQKKLKTDLGVTTAEITAEQSRFLIDKSGGLESYLTKNKGISARSTAISAGFTTESGESVTSSDIRTIQTLAPYKTGTTLNVSKLLDDRKAGKVKITDREILAITDLTQDSLNTVKAAKGPKAKEIELYSGLTEKEKGSAFSRILTGSVINPATGLPVSVDSQVLRQEINLEGLNIKEGSKEHQALINASKSTGLFALELVPVIGTGVIVARIQSQPGGWGEADWKQLTMLGLSGALDVVTIATLGKAASARAGLTTAARTVNAVHNFAEISKLAGKVPLQTAGFVAKVVTSPIRVAANIPKAVTQVGSTGLKVIKAAPSAAKKVVTGSPKSKSTIDGPGLKDLIPDPRPLTKVKSYAEVGRTLGKMVPKGTPSVTGTLTVAGKATTSVVKGAGSAIKEGWDAPFGQTIGTLASDTKFVLTKPLEAIKGTGEVLTGKRVLGAKEIATIKAAVGTEAVAKTAKEQAEVFQKIATEFATGEGKLVKVPLDIYSDFIPSVASLKAQGLEPIYGKIATAVDPNAQKLIGYRTFVDAKVGDDAIIVIKHDAKTKSIKVEVSHRQRDIPQDDLGSQDLPGTSFGYYGQPDIGGPSGPKGDDGGITVKEKLEVGIKSLEDLMSGGTASGSKMYVKRPDDVNVEGLTTSRKPRPEFEARRQDDPRYQAAPSPEVSGLRGYSVTTFPDAPVIDPWTIPDLPQRQDDPLTWPEITPVKPHPNGSPNGIPGPEIDPGRTTPDWKPGPKRRGPGTPLDDPLHPYTPKTVPIPDYDPIREPLVKVPPMDDPDIAPGTDPLESPYTLPSPGTEPWSLPEVTRIQQPQTFPWTRIKTDTRTDTQTKTDTVLKPITDLGTSTDLGLGLGIKPDISTKLVTRPSTRPGERPAERPSTRPQLRTPPSPGLKTPPSPGLKITIKTPPPTPNGSGRTDKPTKKPKIKPILGEVAPRDKKEGQVLLVIQSAPPGSGRGIPKTRKVQVGKRIVITAQPNKGWEFDHWEGDIEPQFVNRRQAEILMDDNRVIQAIFVPGGTSSETYIHKMYPTALKTSKHSEVARMKGLL